MALSFCSTAASPPLTRFFVTGELKQRDKCSRAVKKLVEISAGIPSVSSSPIDSLHKGNWVKLICGASFEDVVDVRNLSLVYTLAGVDCIDCAAEASVVNAVSEGIDAATQIASVRRPWVMVSVNDDQDLHFRKAEFDPVHCPSDCTRPCERVCPANAILLPKALEAVEEGHSHKSGVITERCYGCGRCFPTCPYDKIRSITYIREAAATSELLKRNDVDAIEIHTNARQSDAFEKLWNCLGNSIHNVKLVAVSLPDIGDSTVPHMRNLYSIMKSNLACHNLWQLDGRPMSGDIGRGMTREAIAFAVRLATQRDKPRGFLQLAGGTNSHTIDSLKKAGLFQKISIAENFRDTISSSSEAIIGGIAFGGYARKIVGRISSKMQAESGISHMENHPESLLEALGEAMKLVGPVKGYAIPSALR